jgi:hypothetical protein
MPGPSACWWSHDSQLQLVIALRGPTELCTLPVIWIDHFVPWTHDLYGGITSAVGLIHARYWLALACPSGTLPISPRRSLTSIMSTIVGVGLLLYLSESNVLVLSLNLEYLL